MCSIQILCPYCRYFLLETPEDLCAHVEEQHNSKAPVEFKQFDTYHALQVWLGSVEDSRSDGGIMSTEDPTPMDSLFYLLCRRRATPVLKRRRLNPTSADDTSGVDDADSSIVSCTAFVRVEEKMDGTFDVRYCLDHCTNCEEMLQKKPEKKMSKALRKRSCKKRSSDSRSGTEEYGSDMVTPKMSVESSLPPHIGVAYSTAKDYEDSRSSWVLFDDDDFVDVSKMNLFIDQKIDSTADRVRFITKVLADLAVDIGKCQDSQNQIQHPVVM